MYASAPQSVGYLEYSIPITDVLQFVFKYITSDAICVLGEIPIDDYVVDCIECTCSSIISGILRRSEEHVCGRYMNCLLIWIPRHSLVLIINLYNTIVPSLDRTH